MKNILYTIILSFLFSSSVFADGCQYSRKAYKSSDISNCKRYAKKAYQEFYYNNLDDTAYYARKAYKKSDLYSCKKYAKRAYRMC